MYHIHFGRLGGERGVERLERKEARELERIFLEKKNVIERDMRLYK